LAQERRFVVFVVTVAKSRRRSFTSKNETMSRDDPSAAATGAPCR
jgi:hypothetical protein